MKEAYNLSEKVCLITPARFLFNAGKTPRAWNQEMLADPHLKVVYYEENSSKVFPGIVEIKGGVTITYRDIQQNFGAIRTFVPLTIMQGVLAKSKEYIQH
jgi:type II restriction enzyme